MSRRRNKYLTEPLANGTAHREALKTQQSKYPSDHDGGRQISKGPYRMRELPPPTSKEAGISWSSPPLDSNTLLITNLANLGVWFAYLLCQAIFVHTLQAETGRDTWQLWTAMVAEFFVQLPDTFISFDLLISRLLRSGKSVEPSNYVLLGDVAPTVDVMIACCGEDPQVIMDTIAAATAQNYPGDCYRVFVLDDAKSSELEKLVEAFKDKTSKRNLPSLTYVAREKLPGIRHHFKGGNLHNGYVLSSNLGQGSEYFASLDADMITDADWLRRVVPHLIIREDLALVCPPQHFYNIPASDPLAQDSFIFAKILEPMKRQVDCNSCSGSGYILRRAAVPDIGGLPQVDVGEDIMLSALLHSVGWKIAFAEDEIQYGLAPETYTSYIKQRMRWTDGTMLLSRYFSWYLPWSPAVKRLTAAQKASEMIHIVSKVNTVFMVASLLVLPISLWQATRIEASTSLVKTVQHLLSILFATRYSLFKINRYLVFSRVGTSSVAEVSRVRLWTSPYIAYRTLLALIYGTDNLEFHSTGSLLSKTNERSAKRRKGLPWRLLNIDMVCRATYAFLAMSVLLARSTRYIIGGYSGRVLSPLVGPQLCLMHCIWGVSMPLIYMVFPPTVPEREDLIEKDYQGINRPKISSIRGSKAEDSFWDIVLDVALMVTCA